MTETSHGAYVLTAESICNRSEYLKKEFDAVTELLKASGFCFNRATKRVVASEEVWRNWLEVSLIHHKFPFFFACYVVGQTFCQQGHPDAGPWRSKTVDYEQPSLIFDINVAMGQYSRSSTALATQHKPVRFLL